MTLDDLPAADQVNQVSGSKAPDLTMRTSDMFKRWHRSSTRATTSLMTTIDTFYQDSCWEDGGSRIKQAMQSLNSCTQHQLDSSAMEINPLTTDRPVKMRNPDLAKVLSPAELEFYNQVLYTDCV